MSNYSAQSSITVKRLRTGDSIFLSLELNGKPLYQSVDDQTGSVVPDWSVDSNRPVITPKVASTRGNAVSLSFHEWKYNGALLNFNGSTTGSYKMDSTGKFGLNVNNGALKIFANLASIDNTANDTLSYSCVATIAGVEYNLAKTIDVQIQKAGASSYFGFITASTLQLDSSVSQATLVTELWLAATEVSGYYVKWYKDNTEWTDKRGQASITVNREDIGGQQLFIAEFYLREGDANYVYRAGISIIDTLDEIIVVPYISSANKEVDTNNPVTVSARIIRAKDNSVLSPSNPVWQFILMDGTTWEELGTSNSTSIKVTTEHTDQDDGSAHDVVVLVEVTFDSLT